MAPSCRKTRLLLAVCAALAAAAVLAQAPQPAKQITVAEPVQPGDQEPIHLDAASSEVDYKTNKIVFSDVVISQGAMRVAAEHAQATGLNFANSRWTFEGKVRIDAEPRGNLRSDSAVVEFRDNHIYRATVVGKPADFEQQRVGSEQMARGHADQIIYDVTEGTVRLSDDAWLSDGQTEISGPLLVYNIRAQRVQAAAAPGTSDRVHIIIAPRAVPGLNKPDAAKPTTPAPESGKPPANPKS